MEQWLILKFWYLNNAFHSRIQQKYKKFNVCKFRPIVQDPSLKYLTVKGCLM